MDTAERQRQHRVPPSRGRLNTLMSSSPENAWSLLIHVADVQMACVMVTSRDERDQVRATEVAVLRPGCTMEPGRRQGCRPWDVVTLRRKRTR